MSIDKTLNTTVDNFIPGDPLTSSPLEIYTTSGQKIELCIDSIRPLAPAITAKGLEGDNDPDNMLIQLSCVILVSKANLEDSSGNIDFEKPTEFTMNYLVTDTDKLCIYISNPGKFSSSRVFYPFVVNFNFYTAQIPHLNDTKISSITVINWDEDPEGSRGTVTTVGQA